MAIKSLFMLRCYSRISGVMSSDEVYININYPSEVIKIGIFMYRNNNKRKFILNTEKTNIQKMKLISKLDIDRNIRKEEIKEVVENLNKNKSAKRIIIQRIFE